MNYTDLDLDHKRELLVNFRASLLATSMLSAVSEKSIEFWTKEFFLAAYAEVSALSSEQINLAILKIESERNACINSDETSLHVITELEVKKHEN